MHVPFSLDDPGACTRLSVTVAPGAADDGELARRVGEVVAGCLGDHRRDEVAAAVHDVLTSLAADGHDERVTLRVRRRDDRTEVEVLDPDRSSGVCSLGPLRIARARADELLEEVTAAGHRVLLTYRSA